MSRYPARLVLVLIGAFSAAMLAAQQHSDVFQSIAHNLQERFPDKKIIDVRPSPLPGLYEVFTGDSIVYADASADHILVGSLIDAHTRRDLTAERLETRMVVDFQALPFDRAIKTVHGNGNRRIAVFTDPDCPYCKQLEKELAAVEDVTVYTFLYPLAALHPQATAKARSIWCAPNPSEAWAQWMIDGKAPPNTTCEGDPIDELQQLATDLHVPGTPTLFLPNGHRIVDATTAAKLNERLSETASRDVTQKP